MPRGWATEEPARTTVGRILARRSTSLAPRIVIAGGGFAGVTTALELARRCTGLLPVHITLISDRNFFLFTPMLAEAATGAVETRHVLHPIRPLCGAWGIEFAEMSVEAIDVERKRLVARHHRAQLALHVDYDMLVLALGATPNVTIAPGAAEHAMTFKSVGDSIRIRNRVIDLFEWAAITEDPWTRRRLLTFVVVGAGHAGTELAAALEELTTGVLQRHYPSIRREDIRLVLVGSAVLPQTATNLAAYAKEQLLARGIELETRRAAQVTPDGLVLADGALIPSHCVVWTAGTRISPLVVGLPLPKTRDGRVLVDEFFEVAGVKGVYALGDNAAQTDPHTTQPYVATAQVAVRQARQLAAQIEAELRMIERLALSNRSIVAVLGRALEARDGGPGSLRRLADATLALADRLDVTPAQREALELGALLHDIGEVRTPEAILEKPTHLTTEEYAIVKQHPSAGGDILETVPLLTPALDVVGSHHERWDGAGYPLGLRGDAIPLPARIFAVVDTLDAMTHARPWRAAVTVAEALDAIRNEAGKHFDPRVVEAALTIGEDGWTRLLEAPRGVTGEGAVTA